MPVVVSERRLERGVLPLRMLSHKLHVLVFGVVFEVRVEEVGPVRPEYEQKPGQLIVSECEYLWESVEFDSFAVDSGVVEHFL